MGPKNKFITDDLEIIGTFKAFKTVKSKLWAWQQKTNEKGLRPVHFIRVQKVDPIKKIIIFCPINADEFKFFKDEEIFIFSSDKGMAFKTPIRTMQAGILSVAMPKRLNFLSADFLAKIEIVEKDNEEINLHKRQAPRKQAKGDQIIGLKKLSVSGEEIKEGFYYLYDISAGGMGFKIEDPAEFEVGERVCLYSIDGNNLPKKIYGIVMSVRQMEEKKAHVFKVGVKFET